MGDGTAIMTIQALWTAANSNIPAVFVICNNRSYRILKLNSNVYHRRQGLPTPDSYVASDFDLPLDPEGTTFQLEVWAALQEIPYGGTISYLDLAHAIGNPAAVRAVGLANGKNPLSIIVPCHRVIGSDGKLVGYGGGLPIKEALLKLEGALPPDPQLSLF